jgi:hypothetical protein
MKGMPFECSMSSLGSETLDVISRAVRYMVKLERVLDPAEPERYTIAGRNVVIATVRPSPEPVFEWSQEEKMSVATCSNAHDFLRKKTNFSEWNAVI